MSRTIARLAWPVIGLVLVFVVAAQSGGLQPLARVLAMASSLFRPRRTAGRCV